MIKNLILDFGDIFINLDKPATAKAMQKFGFTEITPELDKLFKDYEKGLVTSPHFLNTIASLFPEASKKDLTNAWNAILLDFPDYRLEFLEALNKSHQYRLFLLSNTNDIHIEFVKKQMGTDKYARFKNCFEVFYLSYEMKMRKPDAEIFQFVLKENNLIAQETLFVDDTKENTDAAALLGIKTWNLKVGEEDITSLKSRVVMLDLALSVLCSSLIFVIFKLFDVFKIQTLYAIITNYLVACTTGLILYSEKVDVARVYHSNWFWGTLALGVLFILVFNLMAKASQKAGVAVASVATKMSLVIPVIIGVLLYKESLSILKIVGIFLALAAVYFTSIKEKSIAISKKTLVLPVLVFLGSGIIDATINYFRATSLTSAEFPLFSATVFAAAATTGLLFILLKAIKKPLKMNLKNILGGVALGIPNYFSIFFLLKALQNENLNSASIFTINNVAIVMFSTLLGILLFKEKLNTKNWGGIALAVISILLVALF